MGVVCLVGFVVVVGFLRCILCVWFFGFLFFFCVCLCV